ncbi:mitochondrial fission regulator 1 [Salmo trutta]|uniref:mitochondrial fission regulator 1 n=1 Tax=Salmo trutta TaxID=8032 RepID=UPI001132365E|nr:mitochondrial fission regulator 1-like [Salmo trutta]XP_029550686.1 mitochondrial fission regulator 1-like [Salmo trutta]
MSKESPRIDMDLAFGFSGKAYGSSRSIVRRIATNLPLKPCPRVHFQLDPYTEDSSDLNSTGSQNGLLASLADVFWIDEEEKNDWFGFGRLRSEVSSGLMFRSHPPQPKQQPLPRRRSLPRLAEPEPQGQTRSNDEAIQKISALETELAELRAQIAQIVLTQEQNTLTPGGPPAPGGPPPPCVPPPPPPPPPPLMGLQQSFSVIDLIQERRGKKTEGQTLLDQGPKQAEIPNMLDVLKDIGKVKLRPAKSRPEERQAKPREPTDAASLIANALKRKFAHRYRHNSSEDKEFDFPASELKPFCSEFLKTNKKVEIPLVRQPRLKTPAPVVKPRPETPLFGQHMLKSTGKRNLL